jgi:fermentation-respiration switch protein FrsA (DUF1100 family)
MPAWLVWIAIALAGYGLLAWGASKSLYYPMRYPAGDWGVQAEIGAEDVWLRARDGVKLHAWWVPAPGAALATLHLHGNAGNVTHRDLSAATIREAGSSVLLLDYRGYGRSEGKPGESGLYRDADAAYEWLIGKGYTPTQIILHGESLGTAVAAELASRRQSAGVILEAPFTSARAVAGRVLPVIGPLLISGFDTKSRLSKVRVPVFIVHGDADEVIAYEFGQELYLAASEPKRFWTIRGATHNDLHIAGRGEFVARLRDYYRSLSPVDVRPGGSE